MNAALMTITLDFGTEIGFSDINLTNPHTIRVQIQHTLYIVQHRKNYTVNYTVILSTGRRYRREQVNM